MSSLNKYTGLEKFLDDIFSKTPDVEWVSPETAELFKRSIPQNTRNAYKAALRRYFKSSARHTLPTPEPIVAIYLAELSTVHKLSPSTIRIALAAITYVHHSMGFNFNNRSPEISHAMKGVFATNNHRTRKAVPITPDDLKRLITGMRTDLAQLTSEPSIYATHRDITMAIMMFYGAFRINEIVRLMADDIDIDDRGVRVNMRNTKKNKMGEDEWKAIPFANNREFCAATELIGYMDKYIMHNPRRHHGYVFFSSIGIRGSSIRVRGSKLPPPANSKHLNVNSYERRMSEVFAKHGLSQYTSHSFRAGFVTAAAKVNSPIHEIMAQTGHKSREVVMTYIREVDRFTNNPTTDLL